MKIINYPQRSEEWFNARLGLLTASSFGKIITPTGKKSTQFKDMIFKKASEIVFNTRGPDMIKTEAMLRGVELEPEALDSVNYEYDYDFHEVGFYDSEMGYGCSPDGISEDGETGLEMKCPSIHNHVKMLASGIYDQKYKPQVQGCMLVTGLKKWVFYSYHPEADSFMQVVERDEEYIGKMRDYLGMFEEELAVTIDKINKNR